MNGFTRKLPIGIQTFEHIRKGNFIREHRINHTENFKKDTDCLPNQ